MPSTIVSQSTQTSKLKGKRVMTRHKKAMVTGQKKTMMQLEFSAKSCLLTRNQRTSWVKCMNVREGSRGHVQGLVIEL